MASLGHDGLNKLLAGHEDKSAKAVCTFAYCKGPGEEPILFQGVTEVCLPKRRRCALEYRNCRIPANILLEQGKIVPARGPAKFGEFARAYDSLTILLSP